MSSSHSRRERNRSPGSEGDESLNSYRSDPKTEYRFASRTSFLELLKLGVVRLAVIDAVPVMKLDCL